MQQNLIEKVQKTFEDIKIQDETGFEFWSARDLQNPLGYKEWRKFKGVIEKAKIACENSSMEVKNHFVSSDKIVELGSGSKRKIEDFLLTRYACYLIAQNGDSRKIEISLAQTYFASQTRKLEETIYNRGIKLPVEFATFKNKGIQALYNCSVKHLKQKRGIPEKRALADFDSEVELKAKDFIYAITDHNIKKKELKGKQKLETELIENSEVTRKTLLERDIIPEDLEKGEDLKIVEKNKQKLLKKNKNTLGKK